MEAIIKGVSIAPEQYSFDHLETVIIPRLPVRTKEEIMSDCEAQVRSRLRQFIRLLSTDVQLVDYVKLGVSVIEV